MHPRIIMLLTTVSVVSVAACSKSDSRDELAKTAEVLRDTAALSVNLSGLGPVRAGMTLAEASEALGRSLPPADSSTECTYASVAGLSPGVTLMVVNGRIARVDVRDPNIATTMGAKIGDTEGRIDSLYLGQVEITPHKYTQGHYLTVTSDNPKDSTYRIVFETDGRIVTAFRSGMQPMVDWVEGCS